VGQARERAEGGSRRFKRGDRVVARVLRTLAGPVAVLEVEGRRLVAWLERDATPDDELYLEVVSLLPVTRFRRLTGGAAFWSLPVGSVSKDDLDVSV
jgi:hypothetical protein